MSLSHDPNSAHAAQGPQAGAAVDLTRYIPDDVFPLENPQTDIPRHHPAPYPAELAERLIRMFSFVGDTVLDPFLGSGTTTVAAAKAGRNSAGFEVDHHYFESACKRVANETSSLFSTATIQVRRINDKE
ncbi:MAG: DNA methyltransferase [Terriglobia bacterium]